MHQRTSRSTLLFSVLLSVATGNNVEAQPLADGSFSADSRAVAVATQPEPLSNERVTVRPKPLSDLFFSPQSGWQTCDRASQPGATGVERLSRVAYQKFYWDQLETAPGRYDFSLIDSALQAAQAQNQKLDLRPVMPYAPEEGPPKFLRASGMAGEMAVYDDGESRQQFWLPDLNDDAVRKIFIDLIKALGARYNSDPRVGIVDISIFGLWGEGHLGEVSGAFEPISKASQSAFAGKYALTANSRRELLDAYFEAFPDKLKVAQLTDVEGLKYAISRGAGIRFDCFGGYYMEHSVYLQNLKAADAMDVWKKAPVVAEICGTLGSWSANWGSGERQYNEQVLQQIFDRGTDVYHLSALNAKNGEQGQIPEKFKPAFEKFLGTLGFRLAPTEASFPAVIGKSEVLPVSLQVSNVGNAPCYDKNLVWAFQIQDQIGKVLSTYMSPRSIAGELPGAFTVDEAIPVKDLPAGAFSVWVGVLDRSLPVASQASTAAPLAIEGQRNGWYLLDSFSKK
ncbi:MAG: DUF4832 domain-containing protein [Deltaproteobacteria bacterium]|nr:DUF4832 domain-containing protein [Deltaproteobacteria bacterium]